MEGSNGNEVELNLTIPDWWLGDDEVSMARSLRLEVI